MLVLINRFSTTPLLLRGVTWYSFSTTGLLSSYGVLTAPLLWRKVTLVLILDHGAIEFWHYYWIRRACTNERSFDCATITKGSNTGTHYRPRGYRVLTLSLGTASSVSSKDDILREKPVTANITGNTHFIKETTINIHTHTIWQFQIRILNVCPPIWKSVSVVCPGG